MKLHNCRSDRQVRYPGMKIQFFYTLHVLYFYFMAAIRMTAPIEKFGDKGEKSGWTYVKIPQAVSEQLNPGVRISYRVKGFLDEVPIEFVALIPMGDGDFIIPLKTDLRRKLRKQKGAILSMTLELDDRQKPISNDFLLCLEDAPKALKAFNDMPASHQRYYSNWIESAKTEQTKISRITKAIRGLSEKLDFGSIMKLKI